MYKQYFKQALFLIKENKLLSIISILGTALAITMIMCIVLILRVKTANYEPESNRDRMLITKVVRATNKNDEGWNSTAYLSLRLINDCFKVLSTPEAVSAVRASETFLATTPGGSNEIKCSVKGTDDAFWKVFSFRFINGKPYGEEYISGEKKAVISRSVARKVFETDEAIGRVIRLSFVDYTVCGVVEDVSVLANNAYAQVWVPYPSITNYKREDEEGLLGAYNCYILAQHKRDIRMIREELAKRIEAKNAAQAEFYVSTAGGPDTMLMSLARKDYFTDPDVGHLIMAYVIVIVILLLVPAINLSGITLSNMRKRLPEIGLRRAFGATRGELMGQVLFENFILTLMGGMLGLVFSYLAILGLRDWLLNTGSTSLLSSSMLMSPGVFAYALLFCLIMNLLSAGVPAWKISRADIIESLK